MADLKDIMRSIRKLEGLNQEAIGDCCVAVEKVMADNIERAVTPEGENWAPKKDGGKALVNAAKYLSVKPLNTMILVKLTGIEARHSIGTVRGKVKRQIVPTSSTVPENMQDAIKEQLTKHFERLVKERA